MIAIVIRNERFEIFPVYKQVAILYDGFMKYTVYRGR